MTKSILLHILTWASQRTTRASIFCRSIDGISYRDAPFQLLLLYDYMRWFVKLHGWSPTRSSQVAIKASLDYYAMSTLKAIAF